MYANVEQVFRSVAVTGAEIVREFVPMAFSNMVQNEIENLTLSPAETPQCRLVTQKFERIGYRKVPENMAALQQLEEMVKKFVYKASSIYPIVKNWNPNDIAIQKYDKTGFITGHKDLERHIILVAIVNLLGSCEFEILTSRQGQASKQFITQPRDLILLRAPHLTASATDDRPFHRVSGNLTEGSRISVTFRQNCRPDEAVPGHSYQN